MGDPGVNLTVIARAKTLGPGNEEIDFALGEGVVIGELPIPGDCGPRRHVAIEHVLPDLPTGGIGLFVRDERKGGAVLLVAHDAVIVEDVHDLAIELDARRDLRVRQDSGGPEEKSCENAACESVHERTGSAGPCATVKVKAIVRTWSLRWN